MRIPRALAAVTAVLAAVTAALPAGTARADTVPPQNDAFYQPPNPLPAGRPGTLPAAVSVAGLIAGFEA
ncbi:hypothetical protein AB0J52_15825, partial [Spirillospora sp. NPDC049652]